VTDRTLVTASPPVGAVTEFFAKFIKRTLMQDGPYLLDRRAGSCCTYCKPP
jgi:hypothetical protein